MFTITSVRASNIALILFVPKSGFTLFFIIILRDKGESEVERSNTWYVTPCLLVNSYQIMWRSISEHLNIQQCRCKNHTFYESNLFLMHDVRVNGEVEVWIHVHLTSAIDELSGQSHVPAPRKEKPQGPQNQSRCCGEKKLAVSRNVTNIPWSSTP